MNSRLVKLILFMLYSTFATILFAANSDSILLEDINIKIKSDEEIKIFFTFDEGYKDNSPIPVINKLDEALVIIFQSAHANIDNDKIDVNHDLLENIKIKNIKNKLTFTFNSKKSVFYTLKQKNNVYALTVMSKNKANNMAKSNIIKREDIIGYLDNKKLFSAKSLEDLLSDYINKNKTAEEKNIDKAKELLRVKEDNKSQENKFDKSDKKHISISKLENVDDISPTLLKEKKYQDNNREVKILSKNKNLDANTNLTKKSEEIIISKQEDEKIFEKVVVDNKTKSKTNKDEKTIDKVILDNKTNRLDKELEKGFYKEKKHNSKIQEKTAPVNTDKQQTIFTQEVEEVKSHNKKLVIKKNNNIKKIGSDRNRAKVTDIDFSLTKDKAGKIIISFSNKNILMTPDDSKNKQMQLQLKF